VNKKPLLWRTLGGVIASGVPNSTNTTVVIGKASFSQNLTLYCAKALSLRVELSFDCLRYGANSSKFKSEPSFFLSSCFCMSLPKSIIVLSIQEVFKLFPSFEIVYTEALSNCHPSATEVPVLACNICIFLSDDKSKIDTL